MKGVCVGGAYLGSVSAYARLCFFLFTFSFVFILFFSSTRRVNIPFYFLCQYSFYEIDSVEYDWPANKVVWR